MKNLRTTVLCAVIALCSHSVLAQNKPVPVNEPDYNKPKLFANLPDKIQVSAGELDNLFNTQAGRPANLKLSAVNDLRFEGEIASVAGKHEDSLQTIIIRLTNYNGARFTLSRISNTDGTVSYTGRIISFGHGDLYELQKQDGGLVLVKRNFYDLVNE